MKRGSSIILRNEQKKTTTLIDWEPRSKAEKNGEERLNDEDEQTNAAECLTKYRLKLLQFALKVNISSVNLIQRQIAI